MSEIKLSDDERSLLVSNFHIYPDCEAIKGADRIRCIHEHRLDGMLSLFGVEAGTHELLRDAVKRAASESVNVTRTMKSIMLREVRKIEEINRYTARLYDLYFKLRETHQ